MYIPWPERYDTLGIIGTYLDVLQCNVIVHAEFALQPIRDFHIIFIFRVVEDRRRAFTSPTNLARGTVIDPMARSHLSQL